MEDASYIIQTFLHRTNLGDFPRFFIIPNAYAISFREHFSNVFRAFWEVYGKCMRIGWFWPRAVVYVSKVRSRFLFKNWIFASFGEGGGPAGRQIGPKGFILSSQWKNTVKKHATMCQNWVKKFHLGREGVHFPKTPNEAKASIFKIKTAPKTDRNSYPSSTFDC